MATRGKRKDWVPPPGAMPDTGEAPEPEETTEETSENEVVLPKEVQTAIKMHQWQKVWDLTEKGRATLGAVNKDRQNDLGPINAVLEWDYPCPRCGTKAFVNRKHGLICVACRQGHVIDE